MYIVETRLHTKDWVRGDLEDKFELIESKYFQVRARARAYVESKLKGHDSSKVFRDYHKGDVPSYCYYYTGVTWQHENSGEQMEEYYMYTMKKAKAN